MRYKDDGSTVSITDIQAEEFGRNFIRQNFPAHNVLGEEGGGSMEDGYVWAFDPIDSTFSYLVGRDDFSITACLYEDRQPRLSIVYCPAKNVLYYRNNLEESRVIRSENFGDVTSTVLPNTMKIRTADATEKELTPTINVNKHIRNNEVAVKLAKSPNELNVNYVLRTIGSPALQVASLTEMHGAYLHMWQGQMTPYDLGAASHILKGAGGVITDLDGNDIPPFGHEGPFIAATTSDIATRVINILKT